MQLHLTDAAIRKLPVPERGTVKYWDTVQPGFGVRLGKRSRSYFVVYGERRQLKTIAPFGEITLSDARKQARQYLDRPTPKQALQRLSEARTAYLSECEVKNRPATVRDYRRYLAEIDKQNLTDVVRTDIPADDAYRVAAWKAFFNWCMRNELIDRNPFAMLSTSYGARDRILTDDELRRVWEYDYPPFSDYLKILILTGQRRGQFQSFVLNVDRQELSFPAAVMKGKQAHRIPLLPLIETYAARLQPFNGWSNAKTRIDNHLQLPHWTIHDIRRTFSTTMARLGVPLHVTEHILAHRSGTISGVAAIYNRHTYLTEMRDALHTYHAHLTSNVLRQV